jgi:hypothetical protein
MPRSHLVHIGLALNILIAMLASAQSTLPVLQSVLSPWAFFAATVFTSALMSVAHRGDLAKLIAELTEDKPATSAEAAPAAPAQVLVPQEVVPQVEDPEAGQAAPAADAVTTEAS